MLEEHEEPPPERPRGISDPNDHDERQDSYPDPEGFDFEEWRS